MADRLNLRPSAIPTRISELKVLLGGDIILMVQGIALGRELENMERVIQTLASPQAGESIFVTVLRDGVHMVLSATHHCSASDAVHRSSATRLEIDDERQCEEAVQLLTRNLDLPRGHAVDIEKGNPAQRWIVVEEHLKRRLERETLRQNDRD